MNIFNFKFQALSSALVLLTCSAIYADPLKVCATVPDLGSLVREVGGDEVQVVVFCKGGENPHFVDARPSYVKDMSQADLFVQAGMELEIGWAPVLLNQSRNARIQPGSQGYLDVSQAIRPMEVPAGPIDRSQGDVHPMGNPHYLNEPINGLRVARLIRDRLISLRPSQKDAFEKGYADFRKRLVVALVGQKLADAYDPEKLTALIERAKLSDFDAFLSRQGQAEMLGGWLGRLKAFRDAPVVDDHPLWVYFAHRFGLGVVGHMEPKPGITPTTRHLNELVRLMKERNVKVVMSSPYFDEEYAAFLVRHTGARAVVLAHQVQALPEAKDYISTVDYNVAALAHALGAGPQ